MARSKVTVSRSDLNAGKKLARDMLKYAQRVNSTTGCGFTEAVKRMRADAPEVARELGVSSAFVTVWAEGILSGSAR